LPISIRAIKLFPFSLSLYQRQRSIRSSGLLKNPRTGPFAVDKPTKFEFVINLKTTKQIGVMIAPNVLARADRVIK
jgi:putative ABC transport system substrate-binding protein